MGVEKGEPKAAERGAKMVERRRGRAEACSGAVTPVAQQLRAERVQVGREETK
jgi:hypothetical protein